jgi:hypothetical protein
MQRLFVMILAAGALLYAAPATVAADNEPVVKDIRNKKDKDDLYVVFCAREHLPGHAFVVLGKDDSKKQLCTVDAFGYYPEGDKAVKALFGKVPSEMANEFIRGKGQEGTCRLIVRVDQSQYDAVEAIRRKWAEKGTYRVIEEDCVTFAADVAQSLKLDTPERAKAILPQAFVKKLAEMNR